MEYKINVSEIKKMSDTLNAGDRVFLSGTVYTSRDAAHKRIKEAIKKGEKLDKLLPEKVISYLNSH